MAAQAKNKDWGFTPVGIDHPREGQFSSTHWGFAKDGPSPYSIHGMWNGFHGIRSPENPPMLWGNRLEGTVAEVALPKIEKYLGGEIDMLVCPTKVATYRGAGFRVTCDRLLSMKTSDGTITMGLEVKTSSSWKQQRLYGDEWSPDSVPPFVAAQCQAHMAAHPEMDLCFVAAWFYRPEDPKIYVVERDEGMIQEAMDWLADWHLRHVVGNNPPKIDGSKECTRWLQKLDSTDPVIVEADEEQRVLIEEYAKAKKEFAEAKKAFDLRKHEIHGAINGEGGISADGIGTVKKSSGKVSRLSDNFGESYEK